MPGQWKIEIIPDEVGNAGTGNAYWWEESTTVGLQEHDYAFTRTGLERGTSARNAFLSNAVDERDKWQTYQSLLASAATLATAWAVVINTNDPESVT